MLRQHWVQSWIQRLILLVLGCCRRWLSHLLDGMGIWVAVLLASAYCFSAGYRLVRYLSMLIFQGIPSPFAASILYFQLFQRCLVHIMSL